MPKAPAHRQVTRVKRIVPSNNKFAALAVDTSTKTRRGDRFNGPRPATAMAAQGSWGKKLKVNTAPVSNSRRVAARIQQAKPQPPKEEKQGRPCAYCKEHGHHIKRCDRLAEKNRKRTEWNRKEKARKAEEKRKAAEARLAEMFRIAQQQKEQATVVEEYSDSEESSSEEEDYPALPTVAKDETRRVTFKGDSENLMKPPCKTKVFDKEQPASAISDDDEEEEVILLTRSTNAWKPKRLREEPKVVKPKTDQEQHDELLANWRKDYAKSDGSWSDMADLADDLATINALRETLGLPELDEEGEEITTDQFGRPSADNSAW